MTNSPIYVFDNIGCVVSLKNNKFNVSGPIFGYKTLDSNHDGSYIPYLIKDDQNWETGIGRIQVKNNKVYVARHKVVGSSANNSPLSSTSSAAQLYVYANEYNFKTGLNNIIVKNNSFKAEPITSLYIVDTSTGVKDVVLPKIEDSENIKISVKNIGTDNKIIVKDANNNLIDTIDPNLTQSYIVYNKVWNKLYSYVQNELSSLSTDGTFSALSDSSGTLGAIQYGDGAGDFVASNLYWDNTDQQVLFGSSTEADANTIIPTSGNHDTVFNTKLNNSNFKINGNTANKNIMFTYDGKLGLNIPSGLSPQTLLHVVNSSCSEAIRVDNRTACVPANVTLFHKPSSDITDNTDIAEIDFSSVTSDDRTISVDYVKIKGTAIEADSTNKKGELGIFVSSGNSLSRTIQSNIDSTKLGHSDTSVAINNASGIGLVSSNTKLSITNSTLHADAATVDISGTSTTINGSTVNIGGTSAINLDSTAIVLGTDNVGSVTVPDLTANSITADTVSLPNIISSGLLALDTDGNIVAANSASLPVGNSKILSTNENGYITGVYNTSDFFLTQNEITWNKHTRRSADVCKKQVTFTEEVPTEEFSDGDQIGIVNGDEFIYRNITNLSVTDGFITDLTIDQNFNTDTNIASGLQVYSVTKGGFLQVAPVVTDDVFNGTTNILSTRPEKDTQFNTGSKDINFKVYGVDQTPSLMVKANIGRSERPSGYYHAFATQLPECRTCGPSEIPPDVAPVEIVLHAGGSGVATTQNTVHFGESTTDPFFSGVVSSVGTNGLPSYYGTFDQNGNVYEWVDNTTPVDGSSTRYAAGGSVYTSSNGLNVSNNSIGASGLKSITSLIAGSGYKDVGFRISSLPGSPSSNDDIEVSNTGLQLAFVNVRNPNNASDAGVYEYDSAANKYSLTSIDDLGSVSKTYRISKFEITNTQYARFLNIACRFDERTLYDNRMDTEESGGITRSNGGDSNNPWTYTVKEHMTDKPVTFVSYLSSLRFANWLHNNAPDTIDDHFIILDDGAYNIVENNNSYLIQKQSNKKYWLPDIHQWHKAAYFQPIQQPVNAPTSAVTVKREEPYLVASGVNSSGENCETFANLSVSGWLYVDHLIVGDGLIKSASKHLPCGSYTGGSSDIGNIGIVIPPSDTNNNTDIVTTTPPATLEDVPVVDLATCPSHCTERLVDAAVASTLLRNAVRLGTDPATNLERICVCPCGNGNCAAWGPGCECVDTEPPELFDITSDPGAFTLGCGPGFFPCPIVESSNE